MEDTTKTTIETYDKTVDKFKELTCKHQSLKDLSFFSSFLPEKAKVLDAGCGFGRDTKFFIDKRYETYGVDLSENMIKKAREYAPGAEYSVQDLRKLDFSDSFFDGIWCAATLHHLRREDLPSTIKRFNDLLKKGGLIFIDVKEGSGEEFIADLRYDSLKKYITYFSHAEIESILKETNFEMIKSELRGSRSDQHKANLKWVTIFAKKL